MSAFLLILLGLPGSGKTTLAQALVPVLEAVHLSSDRIRRQLGQRGQYGQADKDRVYAQMAERAAEALVQGKPVVADATFAQAAHRSQLVEAAQQAACPIYVVYLQVPEAVVQQRLQADRPESEADFAVYQQVKAQFAPIDQPHLILDTHRHPLPQQIDVVKRYLQHGHPTPPAAD